MNSLSISPRFLLPLIIMVGVLIVGMRVDDIWTAASEGHLFSRAAQAENKAEAKPEAPATSAGPVQQAVAAKPAEDVSPATSGISAPPVDDDVSPAEMEVLKQLTARRETLDKRGRELDTRESLIKVAETRVDQKIKEMESLRQQLQSMVNQVSETQAAQQENLVKIYETMKPEEAAKIFETLDMPILLGVVMRMKPKSTAPIMARMAPDKAKELTVALTKQDQLPQIK
jgi:flagellar motility protein MotE (MotC chaperone)